MKFRCERDVLVEALGSADGVTVLPGRLASDIVRALPAGSVEVEVDAEEARISAGRSEFSLRVLPADEFPRLAEPVGDAVTLDSTDLEAGVAGTEPHAQRVAAREHPGELL